MKVLVFDLEVRESPDIVGWNNYEGMWLSFGCAWLSWCDEYRVYSEDNVWELVQLMVGVDLIVGYNIKAFDMPLLRKTAQRCAWFSSRKIEDYPEFSNEAWERLFAKCYDMFEDVRVSLGKNYRKGWSLDNVARSNLAIQKNGDGKDAPGLWQDGLHAQLVSYVIQDVKVERVLFEHIVRHGELKNEYSEARHVRLKQWRTRCSDWILRDGESYGEIDAIVISGSTSGGLLFRLARRICPPIVSGTRIIARGRCRALDNKRTSCRASP